MCRHLVLQLLFCLLAFLLCVGVLIAFQASAYAGEGSWQVVTATAYSPHDKIDGHHWSTRDHVTADGTDWRKHPYGIAAPLPPGTRIWIPLGCGYLDHTRPEDRWFRVDDTGGKVRNNTRRTGRMHIDLRYRTEGSALRYGTREILVYVEEP